MENEIEYLSPGAYVEIVPPASAPRQLARSIAAMIGWTTKGPTDTPIRVRGYKEFERRFGSFNASGKIAISAHAYFASGGRELVVVRTAPADALVAEAEVLQTVPAAVRWTFKAKGAGVWGNDLSVLVRGNSSFLNRDTGEFERYDVQFLAPYEFDPTFNIAIETYIGVQFDDPLGASYFPNVIGDDRSASEIIEVITGVGGTPEELAGADIAAEVLGVGTGALADFSGTLAALPVLDMTVVIVADVANHVGEVVLTGHAGGVAETVSMSLANPRVKPGSLAISYDSGAVPQAVSDDGNGNLTGAVVAGGTINYDTGALSFTTSLPVDAAPDILASYTEEARVTDDGLGNLIGDVDASGVNTVDYTTGAYDLSFAVGKEPAAAANVEASYRQLPTEVTFNLAGGTDGTSVSRSVVSLPALAAQYKGLYALDLFEEPANVLIPDFEGSQLVQADLMSFVKARQDRFAILAMRDAATVAEVIQYVRTTQGGVFNSPFSAFYYPNVRYVRPDTNVVETVPVSAFVAGVYSRTAYERNVGKVPAGIDDGKLNADGVVGPERDLNQADRDSLFQSSINPVYRSLGTGYVVWGSRSLSLEPRWRDVNAGLLNIFITYRVKDILRRLVFENNGTALWKQAEEAVSSYLDSLFQLRYFAGNTPKEAFFVRCDETNNNEATKAANLLYVDVGFSPGKPALFIVARIQQPVTAGV